MNIKEKSFYPKSIGDISILIIEILNMSQLAKKSDIKATLNSSEIDITDAQLNKIFYLLEKMNCIEEVQAGKSRYFTSKRQEKMLSLAFKKNTLSRDVLEWGYRISRYYSEVDRNWITLWRAIVGEGSATQ